MTTELLTKDLIADTSLWRLIVRIEPRKLRAMLIGPESVERSVIFHAEELTDTSVKALENAVYDNSLLLGDFSAIDVIFSTPEFALCPTANSELRERMVNAMLPDYDAPRRIEGDSFGALEVAYAINAEVYNFAARTFAAARFHHALAINAAWLTYRNALSAHIYALCEGSGEMTLADYDSAGNLCVLARPQAHSATDCAYYILASELPAPISVGGEPELRNEVCAMLRQMRPNATILPLTLPEDLLHLRQQAPQASFDMLFLTQL